VLIHMTECIFFFYLSYTLLDHAVSNWCYILLKYWMLVNNELERKQSLHNSRCCPGNLLKGLRKAVRYLN
jgi:hypothetical protein